MSEETEILESNAIKIAAGAATALVELGLMQPLDVVKTRLQLQNKQNGTVVTASNALPKSHYTGVVNCVRTVLRNEGLFSLWKGIIPSLLTETPRRAANFLLFEQYKQFFLFGSSAATPIVYYAAGLCVGVSEAIVINPFEVVKVTLQSNTSPMKESPSTWFVAKQILNKQGFGLYGLNRGMTATLISHGSFNMMYFGIFYSLKGRLRPFSDPLLYLFHIMAIGLAAGTLASCVTTPFDVAKTRIQGPQPESGITRYKSPFETIGTVYREEGFRALYKGLLSRILRHGVGGALMVAVYDYTYRFLQPELNE